MKKLVVSLVVCCSAIIVSGQNTAYLTAAEKYFGNGDYYSASQYYEKYLNGGKSDKPAFNPYAVSASVKTKTITNVNRETVIYKLAESYRMLNFHEKSAPYYKQLLDMGNTNYSLTRFHYAAAQRALGNYEEAKNQFNTFLSEYKTQDMYVENAQRELGNIGFIEQQMAKTDLNLYKLNKAPGLNSEGGNYAPVWMNNALLFTSTRPADGDDKNSYMNRIYQANYNGDSTSNIMLAGVPQEKDVHQGVAAVTADGNTMFLTRWIIGEGKKVATLYTSKKTGNTWSTPEISPLNVTGSNTQQPYLMPDGKTLLFSSDRPGGTGGFDIWYTSLDNSGATGTAVNMGSVINTKYDEQAASYHNASQSLIFSSNGRTGMGGYDFFSSKGTINNFSEPVNFGYPVNSIKDDLYFASRGTSRNVLDDVIISSDRDAACCLELFSLHKERLPRVIEGTVVACDSKTALAGATVSFTDPVTNTVVMEKTTDASGRYTLSLEEYRLLKATANYPGYFSNSVRFNQPDDADADSLMNEPLCLTVIPEAAITVDNVYYEFNKSDLQPESYPSLDTLVQLLNDNPGIRIELGAHTDSKGSDAYNMALSEARAKSVVDYLISKGISSSRLISKGYGEASPIAENTNADGTDNPEGREKNRRTEFKVLKN